MFAFLKRIFGSGWRWPLGSNRAERADQAFESYLEATRAKEMSAAPAAEKPERKSTRIDSKQEADPESHAASKVVGPPEAGTPIVVTNDGKMTMIIDRMGYEYQQGMTPGHDPSQESMDEVLGRTTRVRALDGGMFREISLGVNVLFEEEDPEAIGALIDSLRIVEDPSTFSHCMCLGEPTLEFYDEDELIATVAIHHGKSIRWIEWKHDAVLAERKALANWMASRGIELGDSPGNPGDMMMMGLLSLEPAKRFASRAQSYLRMGVAERALSELSQAETADLELGYVPALKAQAYFQLHRFEEGRATAEEALLRGHRDAELLRILAACLDALDRLDEALARCEEAVALAPDNADVRNSKGFILVRLDRRDEASKEFAESARLAPDWVLPVFHLASLEFETGNYARAIEPLTRTIEMLELSGVAPHNRVLGHHSIATLHSLRAICRFGLDDLEGGLRDADRAITLDPDDPNGYYQRGRTLGMMGRSKEAVGDFESLTRIAPDQSQPWRLLARARAESDDVEGALDAIDEALQLDPENAEHLCFRAEILMHLDRWAEARDTLDHSIRLRPDLSISYHLRSHCDKSLGDHAARLEDLLTARRWSPDDSQILNSLAWMLSTSPIDSLRNGLQSETLAMQACDLTEGQSHEYINTLAAALAENGKFDEARRRLRQSIDMAPPGYNQEERDAMARAFDENQPFRAKL